MVCGSCCVLFTTPQKQVVSIYYSAACIPFGSSGIRSLMKSIKSVDRTALCGTHCLNSIFWLRRPSTVTLALQLWMQDLVHRYMLPLMLLRNALHSQSMGPGFKSRSNLRFFGMLFSVPRPTRSQVLVHSDGGQGALRVSVLYFEHVKEPKNIFGQSQGNTPGFLVIAPFSLLFP